MPLKGLRVLEFAGLAPAPFCGMILQDFGATVIRIDRTLNNPLDILATGKQTLALNVKKPKATNFIKKLAKKSDILIDPFRPGVMEKLGLGPDVLMQENPALIYARLTGFGQTGPIANRAGHDINYLAVSGLLSFFGRKNEKPLAPVNYAADFAGGGLLCALGICLAVVERHRSGLGQVIDSSMTEGAAYVGSWLLRSLDLPIWNENGNRGESLLDSGSFFYDTYETSDGQYMSVGALEPQFFKEFLKGLDLSDSSIEQMGGDDEQIKKIITNKFLTKTQKEWTDIFDKLDACVFPVLDWKIAPQYSQNRARQSFITDKSDGRSIVPKPAPILSRTPGRSSVLRALQQNVPIGEVLAEMGIDQSEINSLECDGSLTLPKNSKL